MQEYRRRYKGYRYRAAVANDDDNWLTVKQACIKLYKGPCLAILIIFTLCYCSLYLKEEQDLRNSFRIKAQPEKIHKILVLSYFRSGSSFLGDLFNHAPNSFYFFEPLRYFGQLRRKGNFSQARRFIDDLFNCNFDEWGDYLRWVRGRDVRAFQRNEQFWSSCATRRHSSLCYDPAFISLYCKETKFRVMKLTRMPVKEIFPVLLKNSDVKVFHLVRDPRGTMNSRSHPLVALWCNRTDGCNSSKHLCSAVRDDLRFSCLAQYTYPGRMFFLRYEDLACHPIEVATALFRFLEIEEMPDAVRYYIIVHTKRVFRGSHPYLTLPYTTKRDSAATAFAWQNSMKLVKAWKVQNDCEDVIRMLDLELIKAGANNITKMTSMSCFRMEKESQIGAFDNATGFNVPGLEDPSLSPPCSFQNLSYTTDLLEMTDGL